MVAFRDTNNPPLHMNSDYLVERRLLYLRKFLVVIDVIRNEDQLSFTLYLFTALGNLINSY